MLLLTLSVGMVAFFRPAHSPLSAQEARAAQRTREAERSLAWEHRDCRTRATLEREFFQNKIEHLQSVSTGELTDHFLRLCRRHRFDPIFVAALIDVESRFNPDAISPVGAVGLMQIMPGTAAHVLAGEGIEVESETLPEQLRDPYLNLTVGISYLAEMRARYKGEARYFLAAYNAGPGRVDQVVRGTARVPQAEAYVESIRLGLVSFRAEVPSGCRDGAVAHSQKISQSL